MHLANPSHSIINLTPLSKREISVLCWTLNNVHVSVVFPVDHVAFPGECALTHRNLRKLRKLLWKGILLTLVESQDEPIAVCIMHNVIG